MTKRQPPCRFVEVDFKVEWWMSQGDIFSDLPLVDTALGPGVGLGALPRGHAVLISHHCVLDKHTLNGQGEPQADYLTFLRLHDVAALPTDRKQLLRGTAHKEDPFRVLYIGEVEGFGEAYVDLSAPLTHTIKIFDVESKVYDGDGKKRLLLTRNAQRVGRINDEGLYIFGQKWAAHWIGSIPRPKPEDEAASPPS